MSQDQRDALIARLASDPTLASALAVAATADDAQRIAEEHGFDITFAELATAWSESELADADLEGVAGGCSAAGGVNGVGGNLTAWLE